MAGVSIKPAVSAMPEVLNAWLVARRRRAKPVSCHRRVTHAMSLHVFTGGLASSLKTNAAVDVKDRAIHVAVGHQKQNSDSGVIGAAPSLERVAFGYLAHIGVALIAHRFADQRRIDRARRKRVHPTWCQFQCWPVAKPMPDVPPKIRTDFPARDGTGPGTSAMAASSCIAFSDFSTAWHFRKPT